MISHLVTFIVGAVAGAIAIYFFLRNNPAKAAAVNSTVNQAGVVIDAARKL